MRLPRKAPPDSAGNGLRGDVLHGWLANEIGESGRNEDRAAISNDHLTDHSAAFVNHSLVASSMGIQLSIWSSSKVTLLGALKLVTMPRSERVSGPSWNRRGTIGSLTSDRSGVRQLAGTPGVSTKSATSWGQGLVARSVHQLTLCPEQHCAGKSLPVFDELSENRIEGNPEQIGTAPQIDADECE